MWRSEGDNTNRSLITTEHNKNTTARKPFYTLRTGDADLRF